MQNIPGYTKLTQYQYDLPEKSFGVLYKNKAYKRALLYQAVTRDTEKVQFIAHYTGERVKAIEKKRFEMDVVPALTYMLEEGLKSCKYMLEKYKESLELLKNYQV